jgi:hypothetical protein
LLAVPDGGDLSDPVFNSHEVGVFCELGDEFSHAHPLILMCYRSDRHEALLWGGVYSALDLVEGFCDVPDGKGLAETSVPFVQLSVAFTSSVPVGIMLGNSGKPVTLETSSLTEFSKHVFQEQGIRDSRKSGTCGVLNSRMCRVRES